MDHIVWDWNGTLLDDLTVVVAAVNDTLATVGRRSITIEEYGAHYTRPVLLFYERLLGRPVGNPEWLRFDQVFHDSYRRLVESASLASEAREALIAAAHAGLSQSLLSMYWHDELVPQVERFNLGEFLIRIDGRTHNRFVYCVKALPDMMNDSHIMVAMCVRKKRPSHESTGLRTPCTRAN